MKKKKLPLQPDTDLVLQLLGAHKRPLRTEAILSISGLPQSSRKKLDKLLRQLQENGQINALPGGFWALAQKSTCVLGEFAGSANGSGRVKVIDPPNYPHREIFISPYQTNGAWHKDIVRAAILPGTAGSKGKILEIVERNLKEIPAVFKGRQKKNLLFKPADGRINAIFKVHEKTLSPDQIHPGDVAILKPEREIASGEWQAALVRVVGPLNQIAAQESIVKISQQVPGRFPDLAMSQAADLPSKPNEADFKGREDWRNLPFVTIDGADARDFDDAIHVEKTDDGWILRVAIADVSHYVRPDDREGSLDAEALARGNSWYFPRSVEPMLPKALSNGLCSLRPNEDRLAMMVEMPIDKNGKPGKPRFAEIIMRSAARLIYDDVARLFNGDQNTPIQKEIVPMLRDAHALYKALAKMRRDRGTLDFFLPEPTYEFDESGKLIKMGQRERNDAHMLIEEFMIAANEAVASWLESQKQPFLYRVHPLPEPEKIARLYDTLDQIAPECLPPGLNRNDEPGPAIIQQILAKASGTPQEYVVNKLCLRSMTQARYQPQNSRHFGLASNSYCHFTSPIRRYADLLTHRALKKQLGKSKDETPNVEELIPIGEQLNGLERRAVDCEREIARRLGCIYLNGREGEIFEGTISGVTDFGLFVEFDGIPAEGLIRTEELGNDWFKFDAGTQTLVGEASGQIWRLGQPVKVKLLDVDLEKQELRLATIRKQKSESSKGKPRKDARQRRLPKWGGDRRNKRSH